MTGPDRSAWVLLLGGLLLAVFTGLLVVVTTASPGAPALDRDLASSLHRAIEGHNGLATTLRLVSTLTQPFLLRGLSLVVALDLSRRGRIRPALWLVTTMAVGGTLGGLVKLVVARDRPSWPDPIALAGGYSFPSGHALNSLLFAGCLLMLVDPVLRARSGALLRAGIWAVAVGFVLLVGMDRLALGVHYLSDVVAGWALALLTLLIAAIFGRARDPGVPPDTVPICRGS
jgi:membrane-associated phospholipid phosphatase